MQIEQQIRNNTNSVKVGKDRIKNAITAKGGSVSQFGTTATFSELSDGIDTIPTTTPVTNTEELPLPCTNAKALASGGNLNVTWTNPAKHFSGDCIVMYAEDKIPTLPINDQVYRQTSGGLSNITIEGIKPYINYGVRILPISDTANVQTATYTNTAISGQMFLETVNEREYNPEDLAGVTLSDYKPGVSLARYKDNFVVCILGSLYYYEPSINKFTLIEANIDTDVNMTYLDVLIVGHYVLYNIPINNSKNDVNHVGAFDLLTKKIIGYFSKGRGANLPNANETPNGQQTIINNKYFHKDFCFNANTGEFETLSTINPIDPKMTAVRVVCNVSNKAIYLYKNIEGFKLAIIDPYTYSNTIIKDVKSGGTEPEFIDVSPLGNHNCLFFKMGNEVSSPKYLYTDMNLELLTDEAYDLRYVIMLRPDLFVFHNRIDTIKIYEGGNWKPELKIEGCESIAIYLLLNNNEIFFTIITELGVPRGWYAKKLDVNANKIIEYTLMPLASLSSRAAISSTRDKSKIVICTVGKDYQTYKQITRIYLLDNNSNTIEKTVEVDNLRYYDYFKSTETPSKLYIYSSYESETLPIKVIDKATGLFEADLPNSFGGLEIAPNNFLNNSKKAVYSLDSKAVVLSDIKGRYTGRRSATFKSSQNIGLLVSMDNSKPYVIYGG